MLIDKIPEDNSLRIIRFWKRDLEVLQRFLGCPVVEQVMKQRFGAMNSFTEVTRARLFDASARSAA